MLGEGSMKEVCGADSHLFTRSPVHLCGIYVAAVAAAVLDSMAQYIKYSCSFRVFPNLSICICVASQAAVAILDSYLETVIRASLGFI